MKTLITLTLAALLTSATFAHAASVNSCQMTEEKELPASEQMCRIDPKPRVAASNFVLFAQPERTERMCSMSGAHDANVKVATR